MEGSEDKLHPQWIFCFHGWRHSKTMMNYDEFQDHDELWWISGPVFDFVEQGKFTVLFQTKNYINNHYQENRQNTGCKMQKHLLSELTPHFQHFKVKSILLYLSHPLLWNPMTSVSTSSTNWGIFWGSIVKRTQKRFCFQSDPVRHSLSFMQRSLSQILFSTVFIPQNPAFPA